MLRIVPNLLNPLRRQRFSLIRPISISSLLQAQRSSATITKEDEKDVRWSKLYHFTDMQYLSLVTRLKIYPVITTLIGIPVGFALQVSGYYPEFACTPVILFGLTASGLLSAYSYLLQNTIGIIHVCSENKKLKIAMIDFMGRQVVLDATVEEISKATKSGMKFDLYKSISVNVDNKQLDLKIPANRGDVYDIRLFRKLFGK